MTKSFQLTLNDKSTYYTAISLKKVKQGSETFHTKINTKALCVPFIKFLLNSQSPPTKIKLTLSTEEIPNSLKVFVTKSGFYRWYYSCPNFPTHGCVTNFAEEILNKLFPTALENGLDQPHPLFIKVVPPEKFAPDFFKIAHPEDLFSVTENSQKEPQIIKNLTL